MVQLDLTLLLDGPNDPHRLKDLVARITDLVTSSEDYQVVSSATLYAGKARRDARIGLIPRKTHLRTPTGWRCSTKHVSPNSLVDSMEEVDCKLCLPAYPGDVYFFDYPDWGSPSKYLTVTGVTGYGPEHYVYFDDGTHSKQKNMPKVRRVKTA